MTMADLLGEFFPSRWLRAEDLRGRTLATVERLEVEEVGKDRERKPVLYLRNLRPLILNRTNAERLVEALGTRDYTKFPGRRIGLYPTDEEWDGKVRRVVRIEATAPPAKQPVPVREEPGPDDADDDGEWEDA
jgi:hypothetical protein